MTDKNKHLIDGVEPKYYARIPNMAIDDLPYAELALYTYYKRVAYDTGSCWQSTATVAKSLKMSLKKLRATRDNLVDRELISVQERKASGQENATKIIKITNIWAANIERYTNPPVETCPPPDTFVPTPLSKRAHKEKPIRTTKEENKDLSPQKQSDAVAANNGDGGHDKKCVVCQGEMDILERVRQIAPDIFVHVHCGFWCDRLNRDDSDTPLAFEHGNANSDHQVPTYIIVDKVRYTAERTDHGHIMQLMLRCNCEVGFGDDTDFVVHTLYATEAKGEENISVCLMCNTLVYGRKHSKHGEPSALTALTAEQAAVLERMCVHSETTCIVFDLPEEWYRLACLEHKGYVYNSGVMPGVKRNDDWHITPAGCAVLEAWQLQQDCSEPERCACGTKITGTANYRAAIDDDGIELVALCDSCGATAAADYKARIDATLKLTESCDSKQLEADGPPPKPKATKAKKKRKAKIPKRTPEQKQTDGNMWEAVKHVWQVDDNASWKIARLQQFFLGTIKKTGRYKAFFDTQLNEQPADGCEVVAFGHWYRSEYDNIPLPENGDKLRSHFETFRGSGEGWQTFMRKANKTILAAIPKYTSPGIELERELLRPVAEGDVELISEEQQQEAKQIMQDLADKFGGGR